MPEFTAEGETRKSLNSVLPIATHYDIEKLYMSISGAVSGKSLEPEQYVAAWVVAIKGIWQSDHFTVWYFIECGWLTRWTTALIAHWPDADQKSFRRRAQASVNEVCAAWRKEHL